MLIQLDWLHCPASRLQRVLNGVLALLVYGLIWQSGMPYALKALALILLVILLTPLGQRLLPAARTYWQWHTLTQLDDRQWLLTDLSGHEVQACLQRVRSLRLLWVQLDFSLTDFAGKSQTFLIWQDQCTADQWRRLQVLCRLRQLTMTQQPG